MKQKWLGFVSLLVMVAVVATGCAGTSGASNTGGQAAATTSAQGGVAR